MRSLSLESRNVTRFHFPVQAVSGTGNREARRKAGLSMNPPILPPPGIRRPTTPSIIPCEELRVPCLAELQRQTGAGSLMRSGAIQYQGLLPGVLPGPLVESLRIFTERAGDLPVALRPVPAVSDMVVPLGAFGVGPRAFGLWGRTKLTI